MKMRPIQSSLVAVAAAMLLLSSVQAGESMSTASAKAIYSQGEKSDYLAGFHQKKLSADCSSCHPGDKVSDGQTEIDQKCVSCHGSPSLTLPKT